MTERRGDRVRGEENLSVSLSQKSSRMLLQVIERLPQRAEQGVRIDDLPVTAGFQKTVAVVVEMVKTA